MLATRDASARELDLLDSADFDLRALAEQRAAAHGDFTRACEALSAKRSRGATALAAAVTGHVPALGMPEGRFDVLRTPLAAPRADGAESLAFLVRLNAGLEARPLARVASGGELSRLMLALKVVLARHDAVPTLVFDEVDQGVGGEVGNRVGQALATVARGNTVARDGRQVLVITHLPQIAACADHHLVVQKGAASGVATSDVQVVTGDARRREIARMLGDPDMRTALQHAEQLLKTAAETSAGRSERPSPPGPVRPRSPRRR